MSAEHDIGSIDKQWEQNPQLIRQFLDHRPDYEQLCSEVAYVLRSRLKKAGIEIAAVTFRAKTLASFLDKIRRKTYSDPLSEVTDFAGVRVVCLYTPDTNAVQKLIEDEFELVEEIDKLKEKSAEEFGYSAKHFIVRLGKRMSGARYDDLKKLVCEIQVRTVLQDAWAIIQHHLVYKREADVPETLQRKLNSLSGLLETADDQFDSIRKERLAYLKSLERSKGEPSDFLNADFNLDSFAAYLKWKFPQLKPELFPGQLKVVFGNMSKSEHPTLKELDDIVESSKSIFPKIEGAWPELMKDKDKFLSAAHLCLIAVGIHFPRYLEKGSKIAGITRSLIEKHKMW